jgi:hypothetical protein
LRVAPSRPSPLAAINLAAFDATTALRLTVVVALWLLGRPYAGASGDAVIYLGRALADLDPAGVGADVMFQADGQSRFSLFAPLYQRLMGWLGPTQALRLVSGAALIAWFAGAALLAARLTQGRLFWASLACVGCLPYIYGPAFALHFGEPLAIPRPFAEAFVLAGLAAALSDRLVLAIACIAAAALFHPIMAAPGVLVLYALRCVHDRRWLWLAPLGLAAALAAAALRLPLADRLLTGIDAEWLELLRQRNFYLFPGLWSAQAYAALAAQAATLAIAAALAQGRERAFLAAVLGVGLGGVLVAALFGEQIPLLLIAQAQVWRASWLSAAIAALIAARVAVALWGAGPSGRATLAFLALAWTPAEPETALIGAGLALGLHFGPFRGPVLSHRLVAIIWLVVAALVGKRLIEAAIVLPSLIPPDHPAPYTQIARMQFQAIPVAALAVLWVVGEGPALPRVLRLTVPAVLAAAVVALWSRPGAPTERPENFRPPEDWSRLVASRPGSVFWLGANSEAWVWFARPNWLADAQGAGIVFSRPLAMAWAERARFALAEGLARDNTLDYGKAPTRFARLTREALAHLCARGDRPAWIVAPQTPGLPDARALADAVWTPPFPYFTTGPDGGRSRVTSFVVARCDAERSDQRIEGRQ